MSRFFVHGGYPGWSCGTPADPQRVSSGDAARIIEAAALDISRVAIAFRSLGSVRDGAEVKSCEAGTPLVFHWRADRSFRLAHGVVGARLQDCRG